jgi:hypothetical protein
MDRGVRSIARTKKNGTSGEANLAALMNDAGKPRNTMPKDRKKNAGMKLKIAQDKECRQRLISSDHNQIANGRPMGIQDAMNARRRNAHLLGDLSNRAAFLGERQDLRVAEHEPRTAAGTSAMNAL